MNNSCDFIKSFLSKIELPLSRNGLQNIKERYDSEIISNFINETVDKITYDIIVKASSNASVNILKTHEILGAFGYIFHHSPRQVQSDYNAHFKIIIEKLKERFGDISITTYPPGNIEKRTAIHFDWS